MKKIKNLKPIKYALAGAIVVFTALSSCKKDKGIFLENDGTSISSNIPYDDEIIIKEVISFNEFYKNSKDAALQKNTSNQPLTDFQLDKAVWLMEAQLNLMRVDTSGFENVVIDSTKIEIPLKKAGNVYKIEGGNLVSSLNILDYESIGHLGKVTQPNKRIVVVDLEYTYVPVGPNGEEPKAYIKMFTTIGVNTSGFLTRPNCSFGVTDWWDFYTDQGKCGGYTGGAGSSADYELEKKLNNPCYKDICLGQAVYTNVQTIYISPGTAGLITTLCGDKGVYAPLFYTHNSYSDFHLCLCPDEMNYYFNSAKQYANHPANKPTNTNYITNYDMNNNFTLCGSGCSAYFHQMAVTYAKRTCTPKIRVE